MNPDKEPGRVTLITRYGATKASALPLSQTCVRSRAAQVEQFLPGHIAAVQASGHPVAWLCDPMHGK